MVISNGSATNLKYNRMWLMCADEAPVGPRSPEVGSRDIHADFGLLRAPTTRMEIEREAGSAVTPCAAPSAGLRLDHLLRRGRRGSSAQFVPARRRRP